MSASVKQRADFHACLDCAMEILDLFESGGKEVTMFGMVGQELHVDQVIAAIKLHHDVEISEEKKDMIGQLCAEAVQSQGFTSCTMWMLAHNLEHIFFDPDTVKG